MKNCKHWSFAAIIVILGILAGFTACDNPTNSSAPDPNYIGNFGHIEVWVADDVDRVHGEAALSAFQAADAAGFLSAMNLIHVRRIIITGTAAVGEMAIDYLGSGVIQGRLDGSEANNGAAFLANVIGVLVAMT